MYLRFLLVLAALGTVAAPARASLQGGTGQLPAWAMQLLEGARGGELEESFLRESKQRLDGEWKGSKAWSGTLCGGYYDYVIRVLGEVDSLEFDLGQGGAIEADGRLSELSFRANGIYRSQATLCLPLKGWTGVSADRARVRAEITFDGDSPSLADMRIRVLATELGTLHFGSAVPPAVERFLTGKINRALGWVWGSRVGEWLSAKITDIIKKKIPHKLVP